MIKDLRELKQSVFAAEFQMEVAVFVASVVHSGERVAMFLEGLTLDSFRERPRSHTGPSFR
jgi:hypothetical protein